MWDMRKKALPVVLVLAVCHAPGAADGGGEHAFLDGNTLLARCKGEDVAFCHGFVTAIADWFFYGDGLIDIGFKACVPPDADTEHLVTVTTRFLEKSRDLRTYKALTLTAHAFADAFPCTE